MLNAAQTPSDPVDEHQGKDQLTALIEEKIEQENGSREAAAKAMVRALEADRPTLERHLPTILYQWARDRVRGKAYHNNARIARGVSGESKFAHQGGALKYAANLRGQWLDHYRISTGVLLGDCTKNQLAEEVSMHRQFARGNAIKAHWLDDIRAKLGDQQVREKFTDEQIEALYRKAERA